MALGEASHLMPLQHNRTRRVFVMTNTNNFTCFLRRHAVGILVLAIIIAVPFGAAWAKYVSTQNLSSGIKVTIDLDYTLDQTKTQAALQALTSGETPSTASLSDIGSAQTGTVGLASSAGAATARTNGTQGTQNTLSETNAINDDIAFSTAVNDVYYNEATDVSVSANNTKPVNLYFVTGNDTRIKNLVSLTTSGIQTTNSGKIGVFQSGENIYIAPMNSDGTPAKNSKVIYAPSDSSNLLAGDNTNADNRTIKTMDCSNLDTSKTENMMGIFSYTGLTTLTLGSHFDTSKVTNMSSMFANSEALTTLPMSSLNTSALKDASNMFAGCTGLTSINLSNFTTSQVTNMSGLFAGCSSLGSIDVSTCNTAKTTDMSNMFNGCEAIVSLDLTSFNTTAVTDMSDMFTDCSKLEKVTLGSSFKFVGTDGYLPETSSADVPGANGMWYETQSMVEYIPAELAVLQNAGGVAHVFRAAQDYTIDTQALHQALATVGTSNSKTLKFVKGNDANISSLTSSVEAGVQNSDSGKIGVFVSGNTIYVAPMDDDKTPVKIAKVTHAPQDASNLLNAEEIFGNASDAFASIDCENLDTSKTDNMSYMFSGNTALTSLSISTLDTSKVANMASMFAGCEKLSTLNLSNFNTENVETLEAMFSNCKALSGVTFGSAFDTEKVTNMGSMFNACEALTSVDVSGFNTSAATDLSYMFNGCSALGALDLSNFATTSATNMKAMFGGCTSLSTLNISSFNTAAATSTEAMFENCSSLATLELPATFTTLQVNNMSSMFAGCSALTSLDVSGFDTANTENMASMFSGCSGLSELNLANFNTQSVSSMGGMFDGCSSLGSVTLGANFSFVGSDGYLPVPDTTKFPGANGNWCETSTMNEYSPEDLATYQNSENSAHTYQVAIGYVLNKDALHSVLQSLASSAPETLAIVAGSEVPAGLTSSGNVQDDNSGEIGVYYDATTSTIYVAPSDRTDSVSVVYAPADSSYLFAGCGGTGGTQEAGKTGLKGILKSIDLSNFDTSNTTTMSHMFYYCNTVATLNLGQNFNTSNTDNLNRMFAYCKAAQSIDISGFNTSKVTDMGGMFQNCNAVASLDFSSFDTSEVTKMDYMFNSCDALTTLDLSSFNTAKSPSMNLTFYYLTNIESVTLGENFKFNPSSTNYLVGGDATNSYTWIYDGVSYTPAQLAAFHNSNPAKRTYARSA